MFVLIAHFDSSAAGVEPEKSGAPEFGAQGSGAQGSGAQGCDERRSGVQGPGSRMSGRRAPGQDASIPHLATEPLAILAAAPGCLRLWFARSTEFSDRYTLVAEFEHAASYRRALASWPMRTVVVPWLSTANQDDSQVNEVLLSAVDGVVTVWEPTVDEPGR